MTWYAIEVRVDPGIRDDVAGWLVRRTGQAIEERADGTLVSFTRDSPGADALVRDLRLFPAGVVSTQVNPVAEVDWSRAWKEGLGPRQVGGVVLAPSWTPFAPAPGQVVVTLDPEGAFGSGEHGSTRGALRLLAGALRPGDTVVDVGSGSGVLAIAAVKLGARRAMGIDLDPEARAVAERNAERNGVADRVFLLEGDALQLLPLVGPADLVVSNILGSVNLRLLPAIREVLPPGAMAVIAGIEAEEAGQFRPHLLAGGFRAMDETVDESWWAVSARRA